MVVMVRLIGELEVRCGAGVLGVRGFGGVKPRQIFEILVLNRGQSVSKERLADLLWHGNPPADHIATLESYVSTVRSRLEPAGRRRDSVIVTGNGCYLVDADRVATDVDRFDALVQRGAAEEPAQALETLRTALSLVSGPLLAHEPYVTWAVESREQFLTRHVETTLETARLALRLQRFEDAVALADAALVLAPLSEVACRLAMEARLCTGRNGDAVRVYHALRRRLHDELGMDPSPDLQLLLTAILRTDAGAGAVDSAELSVLMSAVARLYHHVHHGLTLARPHNPVDQRRPRDSGRDAAERLLSELLGYARG